MEVIQKIKIDLLKPGIKPVANAMQADQNSRSLEIALFANGLSWLIPDGASFSVAYEKPDGTRGLYDTLPDGSSAFSTNGNVVIIRLAPQMLSVHGRVFATVTISSGNHRVSTFPVVLNVIQNPSVGATESEDYYWISTLAAIGNLNYLETKDKSNLVAAINEIRKTSENSSDSSQDGEGFTNTEKSLLLSLFKNAAYTADMSATIAQLETLWSGGDIPDIPDVPVEPDIPDTPTGDIFATGDEDVTVTGATATDDGNGNITVIGATATDDGNGNITVS